MTNFFESMIRVYLIAEIGVNHNGDNKLAKNMIDEALKAGADAVKFQTFTAASLVTQGTPKVRYQVDTTSAGESHYQMIERLELNRESHYELFDYCNKLGIDFLSTPYDIESAKFLSELGVKMFKTASADIVDLPLQEYIASTGRPAIVATGMASLGETEQVVDIYDRYSNANIVLLHCVSNYPCSDTSINLFAMKTLAFAFCKPVGYSDHSQDSLAAVLSVALGAKVIEKHFTLDKSLPGPDHKASSTPEEFMALVKEIRRAELLLGSNKKRRQIEEEEMSQVSRKSVVYAHEFPPGHILSKDDLLVMRPGTGVPFSMIGNIIGAKLIRRVSEKTLFKWTDIDDIK